MNRYTQKIHPMNLNVLSVFFVFIETIFIFVYKISSEINIRSNIYSKSRKFRDETNK